MNVHLLFATATDSIDSVGSIIVARNTKRILLGLRAAHVGNPNTWGLISGGIMTGKETQKFSELRREIQEETGYTGPMRTRFIGTEQKSRQGVFHMFLTVVPIEFTPVLCAEHLDLRWWTHAQTLTLQPKHPKLLRHLEAPYLLALLAAL